MNKTEREYLKSLIKEEYTIGSIDSPCGKRWSRVPYWIVNIIKQRLDTLDAISEQKEKKQ